MRRITLSYEVDSDLYPGELSEAVTKALETAGITVFSASARFTEVVSDEWRAMMARPEPTPDEALEQLRVAGWSDATWLADSEYCPNEEWSVVRDRGGVEESITLFEVRGEMQIELTCVTDKYPQGMAEDQHTFNLMFASHPEVLKPVAPKNPEVKQ